MNYQRKDTENFLDYAERLLINKKEYDLDKTEIYELLYGVQVSSDHARKCLTNLQMTIEEYKKSKINEQIHKDFNDGDLKSNYKTNIEINKDGTQTSDKLLIMSEENCKDINFLLKAHGYDIFSWELISARNNIWNVYSKKDGVQTLYSSKIIVKPRTEYIWNKEDIEKLFNSISTDYQKKLNITPDYHEINGNILVVPIADFHYNLLSDKFTTGNDYNLDIAENLFYYTINDVITRVKYKKFEKVLFIIGNDFINADNLNGTTTKGTPQDNSASWFSVVEKATKLIINGIDMLTTIAPVDVNYVMSNHDLHTMFGIMQTIKSWYRNDPNVTVDTSPTPRKYYKFGKTLLVLSHDIRVKEALKIISSEAKNEWSQCEHIICMLAHLHQDMIYDKQGYLEIMRLPTISGWSRWTNVMGYIQTEKKNQSFIINENLGILDTINTIIK